MRISEVLKKPIISEKVLRVSSNSQGRWYAFEIHKNAVGKDVKIAVENIFNVHVEDVNLLSKKGKKVRDINKKRYLALNKKPDLKKAYVKIKQGEKINLLGEEEKKKTPKKKKKEITNEKEK
ncbi:50S ribosomal protein L23 [Patescibacteria group bacterium]|nr:50S ribosomal protein L23 [Patescibacteria group bacterium]